ncbi:2,3-dihydroxy-2,3-dihydrophenylpropionate dehydrogenase [Lipingzhangella halophila]|uniref:2,3-dihydroxy-2,3-dihydrophenylpropionate dehydrogenase n=1 Tax=Lipingzhangella halophila TaxID=1783352 RepID=A0A7W7RFR7_9ACTN|nr:SDR family NAD(P)-dependent oxidoreductase [Lipingzhangella halophila]MBB4931142.1 2,3-dihydroxy-2,3-dihydrophenylpropionate dehydrogenase [Lipingzhangella halophila]
MSGAFAGLSMLVTGGGSGIGQAVCERYLALGARVTVLERSPEHADMLRRSGADRLRVIAGDATDSEVLAEALDIARGDDGGLDHLTSCVGVFDHYVSVRELTPAELESAGNEMWHTNVLSALKAVNVCFEALSAARGSVTLTLSESAFHPRGGGVLYGSSKWALRGVVDHLSADLAPRVRVNGVAPGGTGGTRFGGLRTLGQEMTADRVEGRDERIARSNVLGVTPQPRDHSGAYAYLADPGAARVVTGVVINTDAGSGTWT